MNWQPIETAPLDGTDVLVLIDGMAIQARYTNPNKEWAGWEPVSLNSHGCGCCAGEDSKPTHWMPLVRPR